MVATSNPDTCSVCGIHLDLDEENQTVCNECLDLGWDEPEETKREVGRPLVITNMVATRIYPEALNELSCPELMALKGVPQNPVYHPEGSSLKKSAIPLESRITSPTKPIREEFYFSFRQLLSTPIALTAVLPSSGSTAFTESIVYTSFDSFSGTFATGSNSSQLASFSSPTVLAESSGFMFSLVAPTIRTKEVVRVVLKISNPSMIGIVNGPVHDLQVFNRVIQPIFVFMMDMFGGSKLSTQMFLHDDAVNASGEGESWQPRVGISSRIDIDFSSSPVDDDVFISFSIGFVNNVDFVHFKNKLDLNKHNIFSCELKEGDAYVHTMFVLDAAYDIAERDGLSEEDTAVLCLAAICHDFGKATTTILVDGIWKSPGHDSEGEKPTRAFLTRLGVTSPYQERIVCLVQEHMCHTYLPKGVRPSRKTGINLLKRLKGKSTLAELQRLVEADKSGRPPLPKAVPETFLLLASVCDEILTDPNWELTHEAGNRKETFLQSKDILAIGYPQGKQIGKAHAAISAYLEAGKELTQEQALAVLAQAYEDNKEIEDFSKYFPV